jgi:hypothetical protein
VIARQAKREHAAIYWGDEMGLHNDHVTGTRDAHGRSVPFVEQGVAEQKPRLMENES